MDELEKVILQAADEKETLEKMQKFLKAQFVKALAYEMDERKKYATSRGMNEYPGGYVIKDAQLATIAGAYAQVTMALNYTKD